jgi:hypothetical protein
LLAVRPAADDQPQRVHALPRSGRGGWTSTIRYGKKGAATVALSRVISPEGPGWSDSGPSPSTPSARPIYLNSPSARNPLRRGPVANSALSGDRQHALAPERVGLGAAGRRRAAGQSLRGRGQDRTTVAPARKELEEAVGVEPDGPGQAGRGERASRGTLGGGEFNAPRSASCNTRGSSKIGKARGEGIAGPSRQGHVVHETGTREAEDETSPKATEGRPSPLGLPWTRLQGGIWHVLAEQRLELNPIDQFNREALGKLPRLCREG